MDNFNFFFIQLFLISMINNYSKNKSKTCVKTMNDFYGSLRKQISIPEMLEEDFQEENFEKYLIKRANLQ